MLVSLYIYVCTLIMIKEIRYNDQTSSGTEHLDVISLMYKV